MLVDDHLDPKYWDDYRTNAAGGVQQSESNLSTFAADESAFGTGCCDNEVTTLAVELLVSKAGRQAVVVDYWNNRSNFASNAEAFQASFGTPLDAFVAEADAYLADIDARGADAVIDAP